MEKILIVGNLATSQPSYYDALANQYEPVYAESTSDAIAKLEQETTEMVLLDLEQLGPEGLEICDQLKYNSRTNDSPIIVISSSNSPEDRLEAYQAGANDFISKPVNNDELLAKLKVLKAFKVRCREMSAQLERSTQTAMAAMRGSSELGMAIQFIEASYDAADFEAIAKKFFQVTQSLSLNCILMFKTQKESLYFSSHSVSPLEKELIAQLYKSGKRFCDFGARTQINYPRVAILVKNMPINDPETYGRFKDFLPTMLGATDAKIKALVTEKALMQQTENLAHSFDLVQETLTNVGENLQRTQQEVLLLLRNTTNELEDKIPTLGLELDQEDYLIRTLDKSIHSTHSIIESGESAAIAFRTVCRLLEHLSKRQHKLMDDIKPNETLPISGGASSESTISNDIELF